MTKPVKLITAISLLILLSNCAPHHCNHKTEGKAVDPIDKTIEFIIRNMDNLKIEFSTISDSLYSVIPEKSELVIEKKLHQKGFRTIKSGRGNYPPKGPRIVSKTLQRGECFCIVNKMYYNTTIQDVYEATESIICMDSVNYFKQN